MKKTLLILSLAAGLVSTSAIAQKPPVPYKATEANVPAPVAQWLKANSAHVVFHTLEKAQAFAKANGISPDKIQVYVHNSAKNKSRKIYLIDNIGIGKTGLQR